MLKFFYFFNLIILFNKNSLIRTLETNDELYVTDTSDISYALLNNPDTRLDTVEFLSKYGYPAETHEIVTTDGYLLKLHRIPGKGQPVLLQHGLLSNSLDWIASKNQSLGFLLYDVGYDVWLGNARGNTYSKAHISLDVSHSKYWNFSWYEMGMHDLPAVLTHIENVTNKPGEIIYIGHSMGTTMFYVLASKNPEIAKKVKFMASLAPVAYTKYIKNSIKFFAKFVGNEYEWLYNKLGWNELLPNGMIMKTLTKLCYNQNTSLHFCENLYFLISGPAKDTMLLDVFTIVISHDPAGTSAKTLIHYLQEIKESGEFQNYDYGQDGNLIHYGTKTPEKFNVTQIKVPIFLISAPMDESSGRQDIENLKHKLGNLVGSHEVPTNKFNHIDFLYGTHAVQYVYKPLIKVMENYKIK